MKHSEIKHVPFHDEIDGIHVSSAKHGNNGHHARPPVHPVAEHGASSEPTEKKHDAFKDWELEQNINLQLDVEHQMEILCVKKAALPAWKICLLGTLSGFWMSLAGCFAFQAAGGVTDALLKYFPLLPRFILALLAPVAMHFIVVFGGEFYSGNCMYMTVGILKNRITILQLAYNWASCFLWNTVGCLFGVWLFGFMTDLFTEDPQLSFIIQVAEAKVRMSPGVVFFRAVPANFLICLAIQMGISARDMFGKVLALHIPLFVYTLAGFEHAIGNLVIVPLGMLYGADCDIGSFLWNNLIPATIGNAVGGFMVGYLETLLFSWDQGAGNTNQMHNHTHVKPEVPRAHISLRPNANLQKMIAKTKTELDTTLEAVRKVKEELAAYEAENSMSPPPVGTGAHHAAAAAKTS